VQKNGSDAETFAASDAVPRAIVRAELHAVSRADDYAEPMQVFMRKPIAEYYANVRAVPVAELLAEQFADARAERNEVVDLIPCVTAIKQNIADFC
jgi:hypothetical protein